MIDQETLLKGYKSVDNFGEADKIKIKQDQQLILFSVPQSIDQSLLDGLDIDLNETSIQVFNMEDQSLGVLVCNEDTTKYMSKQIVPTLMVDNQPKIINKPISKVVKVFKYYEIGDINKHAIVKTKPITLKNRKKEAKYEKKQD